MDEQTSDKEFLTYIQQIHKLKEKKLIIEDELQAMEILKVTSYYSLITGYKDIYKDSGSKNYYDNVKFQDLYSLYEFDEQLRELIFRHILKVERYIKSLYSYVFSEQFGERQDEYLNVNNYNYKYYQNEINELITKLRRILCETNNKYSYIQHNIDKHNNVPLWVLVNTLTMGNISKIYQYSLQNIQSKVSKEFKYVYREELASMLNILSKFRNVCAHNERLYNYKTKNTIKNLPLHNQIIKNGCDAGTGKNDLFAVVICLKYLLKEEEFNKFMNDLTRTIERNLSKLNSKYQKEILTLMGFPEGWDSIISL